MPNKLAAIRTNALDARKLDLILHRKMQELSNVRSFSCCVEKNKQILRILNSPNEKSNIRNIVLINSLEMAVALRSGAIELMIKIAREYVKESVLLDIDPRDLEFVVPLYEKGHWILMLLSPSKQIISMMTEISYILTVVDPACPIDIRNKYDEKIHEIFSSAFIQEIKNLSSEQQTAYKEEPLWSSGHILIDNVIRLINEQELIPGKFCTKEYKQGLLDEYLDVLRKVEQTKEQMSSADLQLVIKALQGFIKNPNNKKNNINDFKRALNSIVEKSDEIIAKFWQEIHISGFSQEPEIIRDYLHDALNRISDVKKILSECLKNQTNEFIGLNNAKNMICKFQSNLEIFCVTYMQFGVTRIRSDREKNNIYLKKFFELLPKFIEIIDVEGHPLETLAKIKKSYNRFIKYEKAIIDLEPIKLTLYVFADYYVSGKDLFFCMKAVFNRLMPQLKADNLAGMEKSSKNVVSGFKNNISIIIMILELAESFDVLVDSNIVSNLIEGEEIAKSKQQPKKIACKEVMQKKSKAISFASLSDAVEQIDKSVNNKEKDIVQNLIESLKKTTSNDGLDLQQQLQKVINIEIIAKDRHLIISQSQQLELASCLIVSLLFLNKNISDILQASALMDKVEELCSNVDENNEAMKLNALILKADLYSTLCLILDTNCNKAKYDLVKQEHDRLKIICTVKNAEQRFVLMLQYTESIDKMQGYISEINSILANLPYPENPDGLLFSLEEYDARIKAYDSTLQHYEEQDKLAELQRENFKRDFEDGLIKPLENGEQVSNAALVQKKLSEQKQELAHNPTFSMKKIHAKCEDIVNNLNKIVTNKVNKTSKVSVKPELEYLETSNSWQQESKIVTNKVNKTRQVSVKPELEYLETLISWQQEKKRRHSFHDQIKTDNILQEETRPRSISLL
jgi:hypothetical protein